MWAELKEAKKLSMDIEKEIDLLLKKQSSLNKNEIAKHQRLLEEEVDESMRKVDELFSEMMGYMDEHKKQINAKSNFLRRHYSRSGTGKGIKGLAVR